MKLTKTEQKLLDLAKSRKHGVVGAQITVGRGSEGGRIHEGKRDHNAVCKLIEKGLLIEISRDHSNLSMGNGYSVMCFGITAKLA